MAALTVTHPTLLDLKQRMDPNGNIAKIVEILNLTNEILDDAVFLEANELTGHTSVIRTGIPAATWRKLYGGVQPTKSTTAKIKDSIGMLEMYSEVDAALVALNGNKGAWRQSEDLAHLEGMNQEFASTLFYGNEGTEPEAFTGFAPRFNSTSAANGSNILTGGSNDTDNTSIWLVGWGPQSVHCIYPKGMESSGGITMEDKGQVTIENIDGAGGRMEALRTHYKMNAGLVVRDWRFVVRIPNIEVSDLTKDAATGADLVDLMAQALELLPSLGSVRPVFYCNRTIKSFLRRQVKNAVKNSTLSVDNVAGKHILSLDGVPVRRCDSITNSETAVS